MKDRQLTEILYTLSRQEHRALRKFAESSYFINRKPAREVLIHLSGLISCGKSVPQNPEALFRTLGIESGDPDHYFNNIQGMLTEVVKDFLTIDRMKSDKLWWASEKLVTIGYHQASAVDNVARQRKVGAGASSSIEIEDQEFLIQRLRRTAEAMNASAINNSYMPVTAVKEMVDFAHASKATQNRKVQIYLDLVHLVESGDKTLWRSLVDSTEFIKRSMPEAEAHDLAMLLLNIAVRYSNEGSRHEYQTLAEELDRLDLLAPRRIQYPLYINTVVCALQQERYPWAADFIKRYRSRLPENRAREVFAEAMAHWHFYQHWKLGMPGSLDRAHEHLVGAQDVVHGDLFETYSARKLLIQIFIEQGEAKAALSLVNATIRNMNHHKRELGSKHPSMSLFFRMCKKLLNLPLGAPPLAAEMAAKALNELSTQRTFASTEWLVQQFESLVPERNLASQTLAQAERATRRTS